jgi:hypothetical protein
MSLFDEIQISVVTNSITRVDPRLPQLFLLQTESEIKPESLIQSTYKPTENIKQTS